MPEEKEQENIPKLEEYTTKEEESNSNENEESEDEEYEESEDEEEQKSETPSDYNIDEEVESDLDFKLALMKASTAKQFPGLFTKDIFIGNIDTNEKERVQGYMDFAIKLDSYGLKKATKYFIRKVFAIIHPTRSYKGFQQEMFISQKLAQAYSLNESTARFAKFKDMLKNRRGEN